MVIKFGSDMCERYPLVTSMQNCSHLVNTIDRRIAPSTYVIEGQTPPPPAASLA